VTKISLAILAAAILSPPTFAQEMDKMWGDRKTQPGTESSDRAALFRDGNYGMFIHWGLYSHLGGRWKGKTFYGIGEWIKRQMKIPDDEYMALAKEFNPTEFDAKEIVRIAKEAGMKYIIITSKHHDGFAMFKSAHPFNIVDATPFHRDPMKELAAACREAGLGFGFYYSHNQDWTAPGGSNGPKTNPDGRRATFEQYFREKCYTQVKEICTQYGPLSFVWFDTPGRIPKKFVEELVKLVRETQPNAMLCSRVGHGLGDYESQGDMEVPPRNADGLWETCDTTNDSWSYAWYDQNWKAATEILHRVVATVGRGGSYLLNVGPDGKGRIPAPAAGHLIEAGKWIKRHPDVVYAAGASPWGHALPWGDVTTQGNTLNLVVFDWPQDGRLFLPGLQTKIQSANVVSGGKLAPIQWAKRGTWTELQVPCTPPDHPASVVQVQLSGPPAVDQTLGIHPNIASTLLVEFADVAQAEKKELKWMEKFGEWKHMTQVGQWEEGGRAVWRVDVAEPSDYEVELTYRGEGRMVWRIETDEGTLLQNQQNSVSVYHTYPFGRLVFAKPGKHTLTVSLIDGDRAKVSLSAVHLRPME
jgi:alpha-L-fucosidase